MIFTPIVYLYVYSLVALGSVLVVARYLMLGFAGLLLVAIPVELVWRFASVILGG
jgi:hypothetical protein